MELFKCNNIDNFIKNIVAYLPYRGASNATFVLAKYLDVNFLVKISPYIKTRYEKYTDYKGIHAVDVEIKIMEELKKFLIEGNISPNVIELIYHKKCDNIRKSISENQCYALELGETLSIKEVLYSTFCSFMFQADNDLARDCYAFLVMEKGDKTLFSYLNRSIEDIDDEFIYKVKTILFQICYTLYRIKRQYPSFLHGDLHAANIVLKMDREYEYKPNTTKYLLFGKKEKTQYYIPYFGIIPKILDFGNSKMTEIDAVSPDTEDFIVKYLMFDNDFLTLLWRLHQDYLDIPGLITLILEIDTSGFAKIANIHTIKKKIKHMPTLEDYINSTTWNEFKEPKESNEILKEFM